MTDDNISVLPNRSSKNYMPPTTRVRAINFFAPVIASPVDGKRISPSAAQQFDPPVLEEEAFKIVNLVRDAGGAMCRQLDGAWVFIPWPFAAIYFEIVDVAAGDSGA